MNAFNVLDRSLFFTSLKLIALSVKKEECECLRSIFTWCLTTRSLIEPFLLKFPRKRNIVLDQDEPSRRLLLLDQHISDHSLNQLPESIRNAIRNLNSVRVTDYSLDLDYDYYTASEVSQSASFDIGFFQSTPTNVHASYIVWKSRVSFACEPSGWATSL